ncbi:MAG TPA: YkvA family protein [Anaerolineales bacterium]|nr:YkvA family protein [Anaerolineales bacterium]
MLTKPGEEFVREGAAKVTTQDIEKVVAREEQIRQQFSARGPLKRFVEDGRMLMAMLKDYRVGSYRQVLRWTIAAAAFALIYVFNPFDIVPDVLPFLGAVDDASVIAACLMLIERDLFKYRDWKIKQAGSIEALTDRSGVQSEQQ